MFSDHPMYVCLCVKFDQIWALCRPPALRIWTRLVMCHLLVAVNFQRRIHESDVEGLALRPLLLLAVWWVPDRAALRAQGRPSLLHQVLWVGVRQRLRGVQQDHRHWLEGESLPFTAWHPSLRKDRVGPLIVLGSIALNFSRSSSFSCPNVFLSTWLQNEFNGYALFAKTKRIRIKVFYKTKSLVRRW